MIYIPPYIDVSDLQFTFTIDFDFLKSILGPEMILFGLVHVLIFLGFYFKNKKISLYAVSIFTIIAFIYIGYKYYTLKFEKPYATFLQHTWEFDIFLNYIKIFVIICSTVVFIFMFDYIVEKKIFEYEMVIFAAFSVLGMLFIIGTNSLVLLYIAIELQSFSLYILASIKRYNEESTEAGIKYFIMGSIASALILIGSSFLFAITGYTNIAEIAIKFNQTYSGINAASSIALNLIVVGLLIKMAAAPFHFWAPDVYEGAPTVVTAFFAIIPKIALLTFLYKIFYTFHLYVLVLILASSILSLVVGSYGALSQNNIKRIIAYSSIANVGYLLIGVVTLDLLFLILYLSFYTIMNIILFTILLSLRAEHNKKIIKNIKHLRNLGKTHVVLAILFSLSLFSLAGIPPLAGFFIKIFIFKSSMTIAVAPILVIGVFTSVLATVYYLRLIKSMFFDPIAIPVRTEPISFIRGMILFISYGTLIYVFYSYSEIIPDLIKFIANREPLVRVVISE